jgi:CheY-like chemotaxis protein
MDSTAHSLPERVVLVVDDELMACRITARVLVDAGFRVVEVHSAFEAVALLSTLDGKVELVVSDIAMPGMTGLELGILMAERCPAVPLLLISGQGDRQRITRGPTCPSRSHGTSYSMLWARLYPSPNT